MASETSSTSSKPTIDIVLLDSIYTHMRECLEVKNPAAALHCIEMLRKEIVKWAE